MTYLVGMLVGAPNEVAFGVGCHSDKGMNVCLTVARAAGFPVACSTLACWGCWELHRAYRAWLKPVSWFPNLDFC